LTQLPPKRRQKVYVNITEKHRKTIAKVISEMKHVSTQRNGMESSIDRIES